VLEKTRMKAKRLATWFAKPTPTPSISRPTMSMYTLKAAAPRVVPARNAVPPATMDGLRPKTLVT
jgi:hypothetical protein